MPIAAPRLDVALLAVATLALSGCPKPTAVDASAGDSGARRAKAEDAPAPLDDTLSLEDLDAVPLGGLDTPYDDESRPPLEGDRTALDLKSLVRSKLDYKIQMDTQALHDLDADGREALLSHLAADPRWRVFEDEEVLVAARRLQRSSGWTVPSSGYHPDGAGVWRVVVRFDELASDHPWKRSEFVSAASADAGAISLEGFVPASSVYEGNIITAMRVEGPEVSLDVYELGPEDGRPRTADALQEVPPTISNAVMLADRIARNGFEPMLMPPGEPASGTPSITVATLHEGELSWTARVNPQEAGWVWLRLMRDGAPWEEVPVAAATRERIGHAEDPGKLFLAQGRFQVPSGPAFEAEAEVWFLPLRGDARVLTSASVTVPAR